MDANPNSGLLGNGRDFLDEGREILPQFLFTIFSPVRESPLERPTLPASNRGLGEIKPSGACATPSCLPLGAPYAVCHVGVCRVRNPRSPQIDDIAFVLRHFFVSTRKIQDNGILIVHIRIPESVDGESGSFKSLLRRAEILVVGVVTIGPEYDVIDPQLANESQVFVRGLGRYLSK